MRRSGLVITGLIVVITEYYTGTNRRPVNSIAEASVTGHGTNVIQGLAVSLESTALPALVIIAGIIVTYSLAGLFGIAFAVATMLALAGMIVALDAFGPVTDNAAALPKWPVSTRKCATITDALDAVGNTTKAVTKGYAIGSAGSARWCCSRPIPKTSSTSSPMCGQLRPRQPLCGGGPPLRRSPPFLFGGMSMTAVGRAAQSVVVEVRRQFKADPGIMAGTSKPDYARAWTC